MKFSTILKKQKIQLETNEGEIDLFITEKTVSDNQFYVSLLKPYIDENNQFKVGTPLRIFDIAKVVTTLKDESGNRFYEGKSLEQLLSTMPESLIMALAEQVDLINPVSSPEEVEEDLTGKKNED